MSAYWLTALDGLPPPSDHEQRRLEELAWITDGGEQWPDVPQWRASQRWDDDGGKSTPDANARPEPRQAE